MSNLIEVFSVVGYKMYESVGNPPNAHHGYQLFYNLKGKSVYAIGKKNFSLNEGECIIVPPFAMHAFVSSLGTELIILDIQFAVRDMAFDKKVRDISLRVFPRNSMMESLMRMIISEERRRSGNFYHSVRNLVETFLLISIDQNQGGSPIIEDAVGQDFEQLSECTKRVTRYLEGMVTGSHKFDLDYVAKVVGYSKKYFCQTFIDEVGMTIKQYLMMLRVEKAKELIDYTSYTIKEISEILNFSSYVYFVRMFKLHVGMTPLEYRNRPVAHKQYLNYSFRDAFEIGQNTD